MPEYLTVAEAAALLGMDVGSVRRALLAERLRGRKFGHVWQISRREVERYRDQPPPLGRPRGGGTRRRDRATE